MATLSIANSTDVARTRNILHKLLLAQNCPPNLAARSVAAVNILTESTIRSGIGMRLDVGVVLQNERKVVQMDCDLDTAHKTAPRVDLTQELLMMVVNDVQFDAFESNTFPSDCTSRSPGSSD